MTEDGLAADTGWFGRYDVLAIVAGIWFLAKAIRYAFPPLFDELKLTFEVSNTAVGTAFTGFMIVYAVMQFPSGLLSDRIGPTRVIGAGVLTAAVGAAIIVVDGPFALLVAAMLILGAGTGAHKTVAIKLLAVAYPSRTGRTLGIFDTLGTFGGVVAPLLVAGVITVGLKWRRLFLIAALAGVLLGIAVLVRVPERLPDSTDKRENREVSLRAYAEPFTDTRFLTFVIVTLGFSFTYNGVVAFLPLYLNQAVETTSSVASLLYSIIFAVSIVQIFTGELADRVGRLRVINVTLVVATVSLALLLLSSTMSLTVYGVPVLGTVAVMGVGLGSHGFRPVRGVHLEALLPESLAGGGLGAVRSALMGAGAIAPTAVGYLADRTNFTVAFGLLLGTLTVATVLALGLLLTDSDLSVHRKRHRRQ
ncbi:MFS transporter [Halovenus rubra]|uniref:MFS transporter n=2 Tax=Halovenus rubra TaxID=869890 RepID=A0ABD5XAP3_9EURY|nr:MFS transporter [Halovenus rubra]